MTTSNRLEFRVSDLRQNIHDRYDKAVAAADEELAKANALDERTDAWRHEQSKRVIHFAAQVRKGTVSDETLADFSVKSPPRKGYRVESTHAEALERAVERRDRALSRLDAIRAWTPEGESEPVLALPPRMATDWFGI